MTLMREPPTRRDVSPTPSDGNGTDASNATDDSDPTTGTDGSLYDRLGGREAIASVVDDFYDRMLDDDRVAHFFEDVDMTRQRAHQTQFLSYATGGPVEYTGAEMREAHDHLEISDTEYDIVGAHLDAALVDAGVDDEDRNGVMSEVEALRDPIVGR